jgi:hypothetical protein
VRKRLKKRSAKAPPPGHRFETRKNVVLLYADQGQKDKDDKPVGRPVGKVSKKFPDESDWHRYLRLWHGIRDDVAVGAALGRKSPQSDTKPKQAPGGGRPADRPAETTPEPKEQEEYKGPAPEEREPGGRQRKITYTAQDDCPLWPEDAKFKTLYAWGEKVRDWFQVRKVHATIHLLQNMARIQFEKDPARADRAARRLALIYADEIAQENAVVEAMVRRTFEKKEDFKPVKEVNVEKDKFGCKVGSKGARINKVITAVPKSPKKIRRQSEVENVGGHLKWLVEQGHAVKTENGRYCLAPKHVDTLPKKVNKPMTKKNVRKKKGRVR